MPSMLTLLIFVWRRQTAGKLSNHAMGRKYQLTGLGILARSKRLTSRKGKKFMAYFMTANIYDIFNLKFSGRKSP